MDEFLERANVVVTSRVSYNHYYALSGACPSLTWERDGGVLKDFIKGLRKKF